jgi:hypothetical protein
LLDLESQGFLSVFDKIKDPPDRLEGVRDGLADEFDAAKTWLKTSQGKASLGERYKAVFKNNLQVFKRHGFTNFKEAKEWEAGERARVNAGGMRSNKTITVAEYLDWWHSSFV